MYLRGERFLLLMMLATLCLWPLKTQAQLEVDPQPNLPIHAWPLPASNTLGDFSGVPLAQALQKPLNFLQGVQILAVGEATHGTLEFFTFKHRLFQILVEQGQVNTLVLETNMARAQALNHYILTGEGDFDVLIDQVFGNAAWRTESMVALLQWMHAYNQSHSEKIQFMGMDMQDLKTPLTQLYQQLRPWAPGLSAKFRNMLSLIQQGGGERQLQQEHLETMRRTLTDLAKALPVYQMQLRHGWTQTEQAWHLQYLRLARQRIEDLLRARQGLASDAFRDQCMADNIHWIVKQPPPKRLFIWAHNAHISKANPLRKTTLGQLLAQAYRQHYKSLALATYAGQYRVYEKHRYQVFSLKKPPPESFEYLAHNTGLPAFFLPLNSPLPSNWQALNQALLWRSIGISRQSLEFVEAHLPSQFDGIVFIDQTQATRFYQ